MYPIIVIFIRFALLRIIILHTGSLSAPTKPRPTRIGMPQIIGNKAKKKQPPGSDEQVIKAEAQDVDRHQKNRSVRYQNQDMAPLESDTNIQNGILSVENRQSNTKKQKAGGRTNKVLTQSIQAYDQDQDYNDIIKKYQLLAGKLIKTKRQATQRSQSPKKRQKSLRNENSYRYDPLTKVQELRDRFEKVTGAAESSTKKDESKQGSSSKIDLQKDPSAIRRMQTTRIKLLIQKQHELSDIVAQNRNQFSKDLQKSEVMFTLMKTTLSKNHSLPKIRQPIEIKTEQKRVPSTRHRKSLSNFESTTQRSIYKIARSKESAKQERQYSEVESSLKNLKQRLLLPRNLENKTVASLMKSRLLDANYYKLPHKQDLHSVGKNSENLTGVGQKSPYLQSPAKQEQIKNQAGPDQIHKEESGKNQQKSVMTFVKDERQTHQNSMQINSLVPMPQVIRQDQQLDDLKVNSNLARLKQKNQKLEEIFEDIQNENNQKQQLIKQKREQNSNLAVNVLQKRNKIFQLQARISQIIEESDQQFPGKAQDTKRRTNNSIRNLKQQKEERQKKFKDERNLLKSQIERIETKMLEQQKRFNTLKQEQFHLKQNQSQSREKQYEAKNKQVAVELEAKTKQLERVIKREKQKAEENQRELRMQRQKNEAIAKELARQQQLQSQLLKQIEEISRERQEKKKRRDEEASRQKLKLLQEIKQLEETQNRILMQYQRQNQAITSMFESMRLKNIELENKLKQKKRSLPTLLLPDPSSR